MEAPTNQTRTLAVTTISALRQLIRTAPECQSVLSGTIEGRVLLKMLRPYLNERGDAELGLPAEPVRSEVEEYFVAQRKLLDADFVRLHTEQARLLATQKETRALIKAALVFKKAAEKTVDSGVLAYWGNLK